MTSVLKTAAAPNTAPELDRREFARDIVDALWSHGFTYGQCWTVTRKWFADREDLLTFSQEHLDQLDFTHHGRIDMET